MIFSSGGGPRAKRHVGGARWATTPNLVGVETRPLAVAPPRQHVVVRLLEQLPLFLDELPELPLLDVQVGKKRPQTV